MNSLLEVVFNKRGYTSEYLKEINDPSHQPLLDIDQLSDHLKLIHDEGKHIVVLPDYDMDGIMSGVLGYAGLIELGFKTSLFIPDAKDGYGFTEKTIQRLVEEHPKASAIITGDVGITCEEGIKAAKEKGLTVLITDHHKEEAGSKVCSLADVVVNPMRLDETYLNPEICGAHVLWQCLDHYAKLYAPRDIQNRIRQLRVFVGIGTVSDLMPLLYENRQVVKDAVTICRWVFDGGKERIFRNLTGTEIYRRVFRGLFEAIDVFRASGKIKKLADINEDFFGYYLAPMFNSVKRLDHDLKLAFGVFLSEDSTQRANSLYRLNEKRKQLVAKHFDELQGDPSPYWPFILTSEASLGILGLLAMKVQGGSQGPSLVLRLDQGKYKGSGRSPTWYPALTRIQQAGFWAAGHESAFGIEVTSSEELEALHGFLVKDVEAIRSSLPKEELEALQADYLLCFDGSGDVEFDMASLFEFIVEVDQLRPFGTGFEEPKGIFAFDPKAGRWQTMGSEQQHVKVQFRGGFELIGWNQSHLIHELQDQRQVMVAGKLGINDFRGRKTLHFIGDFHDERNKPNQAKQELD
jgi:single-stranded-DNA-specific exonuclease